MLRHVVLLTWDHALNDNERADVARVLNRLGEKVPTLRDFNHGPDLMLGPGRADYAIVSDFDDADDFWVYSKHPEHDVVRSVLRPLCSAQKSAQFSMPERSSRRSPGDLTTTSQTAYR